MRSFKDFQDSVSEEQKNTKTKYKVVRYDSPHSSKVVDSTTVHAASKAELHTHVRNWMDSIGMDKDDEDDHAHIDVSIAR